MNVYEHDHGGGAAEIRESPTDAGEHAKRVGGTALAVIGRAALKTRSADERAVLEHAEREYWAHPDRAAQAPSELAWLDEFSRRREEFAAAAADAAADSFVPASDMERFAAAIGAECGRADADTNFAIRLLMIEILKLKRAARA